MIGTPTVTVIDQARVDAIHARVQYHLSVERRSNDRWFTIKEIADFFGKRPSSAEMIAAIKDFAATGNLEYDGQDSVRHVRCSG